MKRIVVLVDFTGVCELAIEHAGLIARQSVAQVTLLHIATPLEKPAEKELRSKVRTFGEDLENEGIPFKVHIDYGDFFTIIPDVIAQLKADLVVVGTHGIRGIQKNMYSENILKLIDSMKILVLVVQGHSITPPEGYTKMLIPVLDEVYNINKADQLTDFADLFKSTIHVLNFIFEDDEDGRSTNHINAIKNQFVQLGRPIAYNDESTSVYVHSYSKSISQFADIEECQLIVWVEHKETEYAKQFSNEDKINLILNRYGIPLLYCPR